ncbi:SusC/RagA family TonB-linked outer membrane protein [Hymenobacter sp.]|uniref:SusC/RagA family TonB-linked outer membrane protein n=1 Tax=Hymenobacter sp. TaxID=1898978 RepID=UPI00286BDDE8|nr:SusC/RagA family TonB-linked outer membrane protein [Hymenobacter sp.]
MVRCVSLVWALLLVVPGAQAGHGQPQAILNRSISLNLTNEELKTALQRIGQQADVKFVYSSKVIDTRQRVTLQVQKQRLDAVLTQLLTPLGLAFEVLQGQVVISRGPATGLAAPAPPEAPGRPVPPADGTVSGRVLDEKGAGLPGVTVLVEGTTLGSATNADGTFVIANVPEGPRTLVISFVGYSTLRRPFTSTPGQNSVVDATLMVSATELSEAVVVGYGTARRQDVTGAVATVSARDFVQGQVTSPERLIQGKVAGVQVTAGGGAPGEVGVIRIRGGSSLNASNDPLIVIDGVPVDNQGIDGAGSPLALVNPNDIETFTILKDASATAIYGSRASNGVILITTKKGVVGDQLRVNFNTQVARSQNYGRIDVLTGDAYRTLIDRGIAENKLDAIARDYVGTANTDWQKEIYQTAWTTDNSVSLTGSVKKVPFRVSLGYLDQDGTLRTGNLKRNTAALSLTPRLLNDNLRIDLNAKGAWADYRFADQDAIGGAARFAPSQPVYSGNDLFNGYFEWLAPSTAAPLPYDLAPRNPVALLNDKRDRSTVLRGIGNVQFDYRLPFLPDLHANLNLGYDISRSNGTVFVPAAAAVAYPVRGLNNQYRQEKDNKLLEFYFNYTRQLSERHRLEVLGGYSYQDFLRYRPFYFSLAADGTKFNPRALAGNPFKTQNTLLSFYSRVNYAFNDRYLLTATLRNDGSSHFSEGNKWGLFPAASVAWRVGQENFLKGSPTVSDLKLRLGYGVTGQQDIFSAADTDYPYLARYAAGDGAVRQILGQDTVLTLRPAAYDANLKWEETTTYNVGLDYGFFDNRLTGSVDVYLRRTKDLLAVIPLPAGTNLSDRVLTNIGTLENRGVEFAINYNAVRGERLNWSVNFNATLNRNKITKLLQVEDPGYLGAEVGDISNGRIQINSVGYAANSFYVKKQRYENGQPTEGQYEDLNGNGQSDNDDLDRYRYQSPAPKAILGFSSNLSYAKASLAFTVRSNVGNYVYNNVDSDRGAYNAIYPALPYVQGTVASIYATGFKDPQYKSDYYVQDASFVRFENVTLGYDFGPLVREGSTLRLTLAAQNVLLLTRYTGLNPEVVNGIDNNFYPLPRTVTLGLNLGF